MNKFDKNLQTIEDKTLHICANCIRYVRENNFCGFHRETVTDLDSCSSFLKCAINTMQKTTNDPINPNHYKQGKIECVDACESAIVNKTGIEGAFVFLIIKYLWRYEEKEGLQDVHKAEWYLRKLINHLEEKV